MPVSISSPRFSLKESKNPSVCLKMLIPLNGSEIAGEQGGVEGGRERRKREGEKEGGGGWVGGEILDTPQTGGGWGVGEGEGWRGWRGRLREEKRSDGADFS